MDEAGVRCLPLPTPFAIGPINAYLIEDDPLTLIDAGPNSADTLVELARGLATYGHRIEDLRLIVVTHQHMDHFGLVDILARRSGADVAALDLLAPWLSEFPESMDRDDAYAEEVMAAHGVPQDARSVLRAVAAIFHGWASPATVTVPLHHDQRLALRDRKLIVRHRPGHSPSDTVFEDADRGMLFAGDHLIGHVSSNAVMTRPLDHDARARPQALVTYLESMEQTRDTALEVVLPGHGAPITDHRRLIEQRFSMHDQRCNKFEQLIARGQPSAYELAQSLWGNVAVTQAYLTISEVLGHVDLLLNSGRVREFAGDDGVIRFEAV
ncbi:MAG TPA: MBL fold metallo-hydrolase [Solirubrobacteraceae bacterium]|nr:MBL fold metallo-hydrolase [Solirubrobacteraceae bacterium]